MKIALNLEQVLDIIGEARTEGRTSKTLTGIASLDQAGAGDLSFLGNKKYRKAVPASKASVILLPEDYDGHPADNQAYVRVAHPQMALVQVCERIEKQLWPKPPAGIHPSAVVHPDASVNAEATIGPLCVIEAGAVVGAGTVIESQTLIGKESRVGRDCWIMPQVLVASYCRIGDRVRLHAGVVIGSDGFGYNFFEGIHRKEPQIGIVIVEDDVEIGANSTVDRARFSETRIGAGTKIDNLVQVAHNARIGRNCILVSQSGVSGTTTLEDNVVLGGQVGMVGHITIGAHSMVGGQSGISRSLPAKSYVRGTPAMAFMQAHRIEILTRRLPDLFKRVAKIEELIEASD